MSGTKGRFITFFSVKWSEKYDKEFGTIWDVLPQTVENFLVFFAVFALGISINGDWISLWIHINRQFGYNIESIGLKDYWSFFLGSTVVSYSIYFGAGGFLHWYFYVQRKSQAAEWKCQPTKFMTPELERDEIIFGSSTLFMNCILSSTLACYIANGGRSSVYYGLSDYGWTWFFLQIPVIFIYQDYLTYWMHRILHHPWLYKNFHKAHHKYKYPTAFSVTAIHPVESLFIETILSSPLFLFPVHWFSFYVVVIYVYIHGILNHSGIDLKAYWWQPWQPDSIFHDNHHQYFHVNFGFNIGLWDKLHGTHRRKDRVYNENIYYGRGKNFQDASKDEIISEYSERNLENPLAHRDDIMDIQLSKAVAEN